MSVFSNNSFKKTLALILSCFVCLSLLLSSYSVSAEQNNKEDKKISSAFSKKQLISLNMLNYMTVLTAEINTSNGSKRYLDDVYSGIINNINPDKVDGESLEHIHSLLSTIEDYQSILKRRERLDYLYAQNQGAAIRKAIPSPEALLNATLSRDTYRAIISVIYMAVDASSSYLDYKTEADKEYLQDEWELEDEEIKTLSSSSQDLFDYAVRMCWANKLDGSKVLSLQDAKDFAEYEREENNTRRILFLESHRSKYSQYCKYWLVLADSYFEDGEYQKCLDAVEKYPNNGMFKCDHDYAKTLTHAISSAQECCSESEYIKIAKKYAQTIIDNSSNEDWDLRYFVARVYTDLAQRLRDNTYNRKAFEIIRDNINNYLIREQIAKNKEYVSEPNTKNSKKTKDSKVQDDIEKYNDWISEVREKELPPAYQPLIINCDFLFALANENDIMSEEDKSEVENMLSLVNGPLFYNTQLQSKFSFTDKEYKLPNIEFDDTTIKVNATLLEQGSTIILEVKDGSSTNTYKKWKLQEVDRIKSDDPNKFIAVYKSNEKRLKKQKYTKKSEISIHIMPPKGRTYEPVTYHLKYKPGKTLLNIGSSYEVVN